MINIFENIKIYTPATVSEYNRSLLLPPSGKTTQFSLNDYSIYIIYYIFLLFQLLFLNFFFLHSTMYYIDRHRQALNDWIENQFLAILILAVLNNCKRLFTYILASWQLHIGGTLRRGRDGKGRKWNGVLDDDKYELVFARPL